jgi:GTP-binding protein
MNKPVIAIIGRPNVGKSTLFNRLSVDKKVIVIDEPGATRDRNYTETSWNGKSFILIDTGGFEPASDETILVQMREQTTLAIEEADRIIFLLDGKEGLTPSDEEIAKRLRKTGKSVYFTVNKIDGPKHEVHAHEFHRLGMDRLYTLSAQHGLGIGELMDAVTEDWHASCDETAEKEDRIRVAVIGRPNVGKSSLVNKILGHERTIVNPVPGTTRDAIDTPFDLLGKKYLLIDTAGIRRKSRISLRLEKYSVIEVLKVIGRCDAALILIDAVEGITDQDARIAGLAHERGVLCILVVNKWDLLDKDDSTLGSYVKDVKDHLKFLDFAPLVFVSALTGQRIPRIFEAIETAYSQYTRRVPTAELNTRVREIIGQKPPPRHKGRPNTFGYVTQTSVKPPTFVFFVREPSAVHFSYQRYLINQIRETFGFENTPVRLIFRRKGRGTG